MASVNKVILLGNLGKDPEKRVTPSGMNICNLTVATSRRRKGGDGQWSEETEWHRIVLFDRLADTAAQYLRKGQPVYVEGRIQTRKWQDKDGRDQYSTEIVAEVMQLLGGRDSAGAGAGSGGAADASEGWSQESRPAARSVPARQPSPASIAPASAADPFGGEADDIPF